MKKLFSNRFTLPKSLSNSGSVDQSLNEIERQVDIISKECQQLGQQIKLKTKLNEVRDKEFNELLAKNDDIDEQLDANRKLENDLMAEIKQKTKLLECLKTNDNELQQMIESMDKELKQMTEEFENQLKELNEFKEFYENELEAKRQAYQRLEVTLQRHYSPHLDQYFVKLDQMKGQSKELLKDIDSIETQINELKANQSLQKTDQPVKDDIPREIAEQFADPIRVITEIAKIKVNSNHLQDIIDEEMTRITTNRLDKHMLSEDSQESDAKDVEQQNSSEMEIQVTNEVDLSANVAINTEVKVNGVNEEVEPNTNPNVSASTVETSVDINANISANIIDNRVSPFAMFSANSPPNMFSNFGSQMTSPAQSPPFNLFGSTVANTSSANQTSGLFGNQTSTEEPNNQSFGFGSLFAFPSAVSPNQTEDSFNLFK